MKVFKFKGGVHPPDFKALTADFPITAMPLPETLLVPLSQHIGAPCKAVVIKGDHVSRGQVIGEAGGFVSAPVHSPVNGTVVKVDTAGNALGRTVPAIEIKPDETDPLAFSGEGVTELTAEAVKKVVKDAGLAGMGGATFPTHVKLSPPPDQKIEVVLINAAECEPFLNCDNRLMLESPGKVLRGAWLFKLAMGVEKCIIGVEKNKPKAIAALEKELSGGAYPGVFVQPLRTRYPQGGEKQLIYALTGKEVPSGALPAAVGAAVYNVGTACALVDAFDTGLPLVQRVLTVSGDAVTRPGNYLVQIGTRVSFVLEQAGVIPEKLAKLVLGGPMTGFATGNLDIPVTKGTSGILALSEAMAEEADQGPCLRCGKCLTVCPMGLSPTQLDQAANAKRVDILMDLRVRDCIECGSCAYNCPAQRSLLQSMRVGKGLVMAHLQAEKAKAEKAAAEKAAAENK
ncbi:electron transport complex subunit RsxC [bacterium]|nr:electron transport complex subunit RsxC [bacterium]